MSERPDLDRALILLDLLGVLLRANQEARERACVALFAPFDPFWPEQQLSPLPDQTSSTIPS
jgi:hypothetical protein